MDDLKALYTQHFGSDDGWLGERGSAFIEGVRAALSRPAGGESILAIIDKWMDGYDHMGCGDRQSERASEKEWAEDRQRIVSMLAAAPTPHGEQWPARYACNGPEGTFWTDDLALATAILQEYDTDEDWTVTDTQNPYGAASREVES